MTSATVVLQVEHGGTLREGARLALTRSAVVCHLVLSLFAARGVIALDDATPAAPQWKAALARAHAANKDGDYRRAVELSAEALKLAQESRAGPNDLATLQAVYGIMLQRADQLPAARNALESALALRRSTAPDAYEEALVLRYLIDVELDAGDFDKAATLGENCIELVFGLGADKRSLIALEGIASAYARMGLYRTAGDLARRCLECRQEGASDSALSELGSRVVIGAAAYYLADYKEAEHSLRASIEIARGRLGTAHPATLGLLQNLTRTMLRQRRVKTADELLSKCSAIAKKIGRQLRGRDRARMEFVASDVRFAQGQADEAKLRLNAALKILSESNMAEHPDSADCHYLLGEVLKSDPSAAREHFWAARKMYTKAMGGGHPKALRALLQAIQCDVESEKENLPARDYQTALSVLVKRIGVNHPDVVAFGQWIEGRTVRKDKSK